MFCFTVETEFYVVNFVVLCVGLFADIILVPYVVAVPVDFMFDMLQYLAVPVDITSVCLMICCSI